MALTGNGHLLIYQMGLCGEFPGRTGQPRL